MTQYRIVGGNKLSGSVDITGSKNSILPLMAASIVVEGKTILHNVPQIRDVEVMNQILTDLGADISGLGTKTLIIDTTKINNYKVIPEMAQKLRASIILLGPLLARFRQVSLGFPGGDTIGKRAIGTHLDGLAIFGTYFSITPNVVTGKLSRGKDDSKYLFLDEASVTATENMLIFASRFLGQTTIENAACEPHICDLANFLTKMGAKIDGIGSNQLKIVGVKKPREVEMTVGSDYIDAGTFAIAAAITNGKINIKPIRENDMRMTLLYLSRFGVQYKWASSDELEILPSELSADPENLGIRQKFQTRPWPGFPTDLMSPLIVLATQANGSVLLHDWMYETRMFFTDKLVTMGANITLCDPHRVIVTGPTKLIAKPMITPDIRAGMSYLLASLVADGESVIDHAELIERGHEDPVRRFQELGAKITCKEIP